MKRTVIVILASVLAFPQCALPLKGRDTTGVDSRVRQQPDPDVLSKYVMALPIGSKVNIHLIDGHHFDAILMIADANQIVVKPRTRVPEPERTLALGSVAFVELIPERPQQTIGQAVAVGAAGVGAAIGLAFLAMWAAFQ
jgi:hypothetical protein